MDSNSSYSSSFFCSYDPMSAVGAVQSSDTNNSTQWTTSWGDNNGFISFGAAQPPQQSSGVNPAMSNNFVKGGHWKRGTYPKKGGPPGRINNKPNFAKPSNLGKAPKKVRPLDTTGKTPAMIIHEIFKDVSEDYTHVPDSNPKKFCCILTVSGQVFKMESFNKKTAKHKCAELALKELRPDIVFAPYPEKEEIKSQPPKRNAEKEQTESSPKKVKLSPVESATSLLDFMTKLIQQYPQKTFEPKFEVSDTKLKIEPVGMKTETTNGENPGDWRQENTEYTVSLNFGQQGKVYSKSGSNRHILKDLVVREALLDLFSVSMDDIRKVSRRAAMNKLGSDFSIMQALNTMCSVMNCTMTLSADKASNEVPPAKGNVGFIGKCQIVDHRENDKTVSYSSPELQSKQVAKDYAAQEMLRNYFEIDPTTCKKTEDLNMNVMGACAVLHTILNRQTKMKTKIVYEFRDNVPEIAGQSGTMFYADCIIDGKDKYTGSGKSKKLAKNAAAEVALKKLFNIDYDPKMAYPLAMNRRLIAESQASKLCRDISEFVRFEYLSMTKSSSVRPSNQIACFVLINEKLEKRLMSIGGSMNYVIEPDALHGSNGTNIIHMDPIILARRSLIRYFLKELALLETEPNNSIFVRHSDGKAMLRPNYKLVLFANFPPVCSHSVDDSKTRRLAYITPTTLEPVPDDVLDFAEITNNKSLRIHCAADKVYKWSVLGVQGALLSNLIHPVVPSKIFFGAEAPVSDESLKYALCRRLEGSDCADIELESIKAHMRALSSYCHVFTRGFDEFEILDYSIGRTDRGSPSRICKAEIFEEYRKVNKGKEVSNYHVAKMEAVDYQVAKKKLYEDLVKTGWGKWQQKPMELCDNFVLASCD